jgi:hypothetical protein
VFSYFLIETIPGGKQIRVLNIVCYDFCVVTVFVELDDSWCIANTIILMIIITIIALYCKGYEFVPIDSKTKEINIEGYKYTHAH